MNIFQQVKKLIFSHWHKYSTMNYPSFPQQLCFQIKNQANPDIPNVVFDRVNEKQYYIWQ